MELGRRGITLSLSLLAMACSERRTIFNDAAGTEEAGDGGEATGRAISDSGKNDRGPTVSAGDGGARDTDRAVTEASMDGGADGGEPNPDQTRPTFLPEERPLPTPELIEPDPVEINVGDSVPPIAVRLARFIWRTEPDATTVALARNGQLDSAQGVYDEAERLLADVRAERGFLSFFGAWAEVARPSTSALTPLDGDGEAVEDGGVRTRFDVAARAELDGYFLSLVSSGAGLRDLVQQPFAVTEPSLVDLFAGEPAVERAGAFSQPFVLAAGSYSNRPSPSRRGAFIARRLLCEDVAASDHPAVGSLPTGTTSREWLKTETKASACAQCHAVIDQLGFALDGFDERGRARDTEAGEPVSSQADLSAVNVPDADGPAALGISLLHHRNTLPCVLSHWFEYALQREPREEDNASWIELVRGSEFYEIREIPALIAATSSFRAD